MTHRSRTILVVEDNPMTRKMLRVTLESDGYHVVEAGDARGAMDAAMRELPSLILQDVVLPDMSGLDLVRHLRELPGGHEIPILALTGFLGGVEEACSANDGFTAVLSKPVEPSRLLEVLRTYFPEFEPAPASRGPTRTVLAVDDDPVQLKFTRLRLELFGFHVIAAGGSRDALRLAHEHAPDVVLADVLMPEVDGFQFCYAIRRDPQLANIPVVLASAWYETEADRSLAAQVGANALVARTPNLNGVIAALTSAIAEGAPRTCEEPSLNVQLQHAKVVIRQLERQISVGSELARRCTLQAAQLSLLGGIADALARKSDTDAALRDVLAATLDAAGISKGAIFLLEPGTAMSLRHAIGFSNGEQSGLAGFFGQSELLDELVARQATVSIPSSSFPEDAGRELLRHAEVASAQIVPLVSEGRSIGAMFLGAKRTDVTNEDAIAFARAMGNQLAQSLELASSFSRLATSELRYRTVTESANDLVCILTPDGVIVEVNRSMEEALGCGREQIVGRHLRDFAAAGHERDNAAAYGHSLTNGGRAAPTAMRGAGGETVLVQFSNRAVEVGGETLVFSIGRDVTDQVRAQAQLMVADRMVSVGTLAAGVAHEINNPLATTLGNLEFACEIVAELTEPEETLVELRGALEDAREAADRVRTIVRDLKLFSRAEEDPRGPVDVERVLDSSLRMAWNEIRHRARLSKHYDAVPPAEANESRLGQVFLNLIVNAAHAIPDGQADRNEIAVGTRLDGTGRILVEVKDTGSGIPADVQARLFTPFFTTKPPGVGTGLGLSICQRIISSLGGEITFESREGHGSVFRVFLPVATSHAAASSSGAPVVMTASRRGRILVVDDEPMIATVIKRMLASQHHVDSVVNGRDAAARILAGERFDLIFCDLMMPVMTGIEFYEQIQRAVPEQAEAIVFLTGGAFTAQAREFLDGLPHKRLEKPFARRALEALVNERLS